MRVSYKIVCIKLEFHQRPMPLTSSRIFHFFATGNFAPQKLIINVRKWNHSSFLFMFITIFLCCLVVYYDLRYEWNMKNQFYVCKKGKLKRKKLVCQLLDMFFLWASEWERRYYWVLIDRCAQKILVVESLPDNFCCCWVFVISLKTCFHRFIGFSFLSSVYWFILQCVQLIAIYRRNQQICWFPFYVTKGLQCKLAYSYV